jgi:hypothetical protein
VSDSAPAWGRPPDYRRPAADADAAATDLGGHARRHAAFHGGKAPGTDWLTWPVVAIAGVGASGVAELPIGVAAFGTISLVNITITGLGAAANCGDKGWSTVKCGGSALAFAASLATAGVASNQTEPELRAAAAAAGLVWSHISQLASH